MSAHSHAIPAFYPAAEFLSVAIQAVVLVFKQNRVTVEIQACEYVG